MPARMEKTATPGVYKRGSRYVVVWRHKGRQHKSAHRTLAEAREAKGKRQAGERTPATRQSFEDYAREWLDSYEGQSGGGLSVLTREAYRRAMLGRAIPFFGRSKLAEVEPPDVRRFIASLKAEGLAPSTIRKELAPVKVMFATAVEDGALRSNPAAGRRVNGSRRGADEEPAEERAKAMTRAELGTLLSEVPEEWRLFFELLAHSGLRISEALGLTWEDVEFGERPRLVVRRQLFRGQLVRLKSDSSRRDVPLSPGVARRLWVSRRSRGEGEPVFPSATGTPLQASNVRRRVLEPARTRAGLPWVGFHAFRHTCASLLFENGKHIKQVSKWLGHADAAFTLKTYVHLMDEGVGDADFLDRVTSPTSRRVHAPGDSLSAISASQVGAF